MLYLSSFSLPDRDREFDFFRMQKSRAYNTYYPFQVFPDRGLYTIDFEPITIFYGGNGSGKTTLLNVIAEKIQAKRSALYNRSVFFGDYLELCGASFGPEKPEIKEIVTSDDVFEYMLSLRSLNEGIDQRRSEMFEEYLEKKYKHTTFRSLADYDELRLANQAKSKTQSRYVRDNLGMNIREYSNGENALHYFTERVQENGIYLLDEPENSLSPENQEKLAGFLYDSARFFSCQIIMATHSPFLLSMNEAKVYDLDASPAAPAKWTELKNVRRLYEFFQTHKDDFQPHKDDVG